MQAQTCLKIMLMVNPTPPKMQRGRAAAPPFLFGLAMGVALPPFAGKNR
jgi:hypothetical protein